MIWMVINAHFQILKVFPLKDKQNLTFILNIKQI